MSDKNIVVFFGCKNITKSSMINFHKKIAKIDYLVTISPERGKLNRVAGYMDLTTFAKKNKIKHYIANSYSLQDENDLDFICNLNINIAFVIGWQRLIPARILKNVRTGVFGMHGSSDGLPKGRGRSPLNWSLILGRKQFYTSLIKYGDNIDGGGIIDSHCFDIKKNDTIETLHFKNMLSMNKIIKKNYTNIINRDFSLKIQNNKAATYFPKRDPHDGELDWSLKTKHIINISQALSKPFPGCFSTIKGEKIIIWRMAEFSTSFEYLQSIPGEIVEVFYNKKFLVKTIDSTLIVHEYDIENEDRIRQGNKFDSINFSKTYQEIENRYPPFVKLNQKEITLEKMEDLYKT